MKQELHSVADLSAENPKGCRLLDEAEYSVGDTRITCRLFLEEAGTDDLSASAGTACLLVLTANGQESLSIRPDSLETGEMIFSLLTQNDVSLCHVADILEDREISAQISSSVI